ncbi:MAG: hypothetical protein EPN82_07830 [Bacteroidetes bacterium]|nr:MAG: hypothetical protein EPN82_07830 [Bacteroidota bacterium]
MKKILPFLMVIFLFISCENTEIQEQNNKLIGFVNVELLRIHESGVVLGKFYPNYYLSGVKVDLMKNGIIIKTAHTFPDTNSDNIYLFENIELNVPYRIRITLNEDFIDTTEEFTVTENDTIFVTDTVEGKPDWMKNTKYYVAMLNEPEKNIVFDLLTNQQNLNVIPIPFTKEGEIDFFVEKTSNIEFEIFDIKKTFSKILYNKVFQSGKNMITFGEDLDDGLYFIRMKIDNIFYYCPFIKGYKGTPKKP